MTLTKTLAAALAIAGLVGHGDVAQAQFGKAEQKCRATIAKSGSKLTDTVRKTLAKCHKSRNSNKGVSGAVDCNRVTTATDPKGKVTKARGKLTDAVGGPKDKCAGLTPGDLDYSICPAPCFSEVGAIASFGDVADCVACLAENAATDALSDGVGAPASFNLPLDKPTAKCAAGLAKEQGKLAKAIVGNRVKCQGAAEKEGAADTSVCAAASIAKIDDAIAKAAAGIAKSCGPGAILSLMGACDDADAAAVSVCVLSAGTAESETLWQRFYALEGAGTTTTTTTSTTSTTTTSSTTTTTIEATWTAIQQLLSSECSSCHTTGSSGGLTGLGNFDAGHANTVNTPSTQSALDRIEPGDANLSYLMHKLDGTHMDPPANGSGLRMPRLQPQLDQATRDQIRAWINAGALKN